MFNDFKSNLLLYLFLAFLTPLIVYVIKQTQFAGEKTTLEKVSSQFKRFHSSADQIPALDRLATYEEIYSKVHQFAQQPKIQKDVYIYNPDAAIPDFTKGYNIKLSALYQYNFLKDLRKEDPLFLTYWLHYDYFGEKIEFKVMEAHEGDVFEVGYLKYHHRNSIHKVGTIDSIRKNNKEEIIYYHLHPDWIYTHEKIYSPVHPGYGEALDYDMTQLPYAKVIEKLPTIQEILATAYSFYKDLPLNQRKELSDGRLIIKDDSIKSYDYLTYAEVETMPVFERLLQELEKPYPSSIRYSPDSVQIKLGIFSPLSHLKINFSAKTAGIPTERLGKVVKTGNYTYEYYPHPGWVIRKERLDY